MKKATSIFIFIAILIGALAGCNRIEGKTTVRKFITNYSSNKKDESYYETHNLDFYHLYDIEFNEAEITESSSGTEYYFSLFASIDGKPTAKMLVLTNEKTYVESVSVSLNESLVNLFESKEELYQYYATIVTSINNKISKKDAQNAIEQLLNQNEYMAKVSIENCEITSLIENEILYFFLFVSDPQQTQSSSKEHNSQDSSDQQHNNASSWDFKDFNAIPFSIDEFYNSYEDSNWYDNGIFSTYMELAYPNDSWEYFGSFNCNMEVNPYGYTGFQIYSHQCEEAQRVYTYLVPISPASPPEVYAFDEISKTMKLVFSNGRIFD